MAKDTDMLVEKIKRDIPEGSWPEWPGGYPGEVEAAVLDSVFSVRASYGTATTGVRAVVARWREHRGGHIDDLTELASTGVDEVSAILSNAQKLPGGQPKAEAATAAAAALVRAGARHAADINDRDELRRAWCSIKGLSDVTWAYVLMLLGLEGVKADTMVRRFVSDAVGHPATGEAARSLVTEAAEVLGVGVTRLDHAIWSWQRTRS
jgi:hypothetical protein